VAILVIAVLALAILAGAYYYISLAGPPAPTPRGAVWFAPSHEVSALPYNAVARDQDFKSHSQASFKLRDLTSCPGRATYIVDAKKT